MKNKWIIIGVVVLIMIFNQGQVTEDKKEGKKEAAICYQESANVATACGGLGTGSYSCEGTWSTTQTCALTYDGSWDTFGMAQFPSPSVRAFFNYTKPVGALTTSLWRIKDNLFNNDYPIPASCWSQQPLQLRMFATSNWEGRWQCWDGIDWVDILSASGYWVYEEAMLWDIRDISSASASPGTMASDGAVGTQGWSTTNNAKVSDDSMATAQLNGAGTTSHYLDATNFGFSIPIGATIEGILVEIEVRALNNVIESSIKIIKSTGELGATDKSTGAILPSPESYVSYGSSSDLWGETWDSEDINNANFGVVYSIVNNVGNARRILVDHIRITVYYTDSTDCPTLKSNAFDSITSWVTEPIAANKAAKRATAITAVTEWITSC